MIRLKLRKNGIDRYTTTPADPVLAVVEGRGDDRLWTALAYSRTSDAKLDAGKHVSVEAAGKALNVLLAEFGIELYRDEDPVFGMPRMTDAELAELMVLARHALDAGISPQEKQRFAQLASRAARELADR